MGMGNWKKLFFFRIHVIFCFSLQVSAYPGSQSGQTHSDEEEVLLHGGEDDEEER